MRILPILCLLALTGCEATMGVKVDPSVLGRFREGETTPLDAIALLGQPSATGTRLGTDGSFRIYQWAYAHTKSFGGVDSFGGLELAFGQDGKLKRKTLTDLNPTQNQGPNDPATTHHN